MLTPFHLAINVTDLETTRVFYGEVLGAKEGRSTRSWVDFDFFGHQLSFHLGPVMKLKTPAMLGIIWFLCRISVWFWPCRSGKPWQHGSRPRKWPLFCPLLCALKANPVSNGLCSLEIHPAIPLKLRALPI